MKMSGPPFKNKFSSSCPVAAQQLRWKIENDVDYTQSTKNKPICLKNYSHYSICLPPLNAFPQEFKHWYNICVLDLDMKDDLQRAKVINWCRTAKALYPVKTAADGNCLLHAVSLALWGVEDDDQFLRRLVYIALAQDSGCFQRRWLLQLRQNNQERPGDFNFRIESEDWKREWETVIMAASDLPASGPGLQYTMLESIHLYVVANILKRPIIVLGDNKARSIHGQSIQENNLLGIYLPLEWRHSDVSKCPVVIGYSFNHFAPLVSQENTPDGRAIDGEYVVPLILSDQTQLPLKFLLANEEPVAHELLRQYLKIQTVPLTLQDSIMEVPAAKVEHLTIHDDDNIVAAHRIDCERIYSQWVQTEFGQTSATSIAHPVAETNEQGVPQPANARTRNPIASNENEVPEHDFQFWPNAKCITEGCEMFGSPGTANMCSKCFEEYTVRFDREERARKGLEPVNFSVGPTAPPASMPAPQSGVFLSIMGEQCHNKCGLRCSTNTYPYCYECAATRPAEPVQNLIRQGDNLQTVQEIPLAAQGQGQVRTCKSELCINPPTEGCDNYCKQCYDKMEENLFGEGEENLNSLLPHTTTPKKQTGQNTMKVNLNNEFNDICMSPNCKEKAVRGKCARCIIKSGSTDSLLNSASSPSSETYLMQVSTAPIVPAVPQHLSAVHVPQQPSAVPQGFSIPQGAAFPQASAAVQTSTQTSNSPSPPEAYQYYKCKNAFCENFADQNTLDSYCKHCVEARHGSNVQQQNRMAYQNSPAAKHLCPTPGCEGVRLTNSPYCLKCTQSNRSLGHFGHVVTPSEGGAGQESQPLESRTPSSAFAMAVETANPVITSSKQKVNCASPLCKTLIYPPKRLCDSCTEILRQNHARIALAQETGQDQRSRSLEMLRESPVKHGQSYSPSRQKCIEQGCTYYGDKRFNGYCSQCYNDKRSRKAKTTAGMIRPTPQLSHVKPQTVPVAERPRNCIEHGCDRYGDPNMMGRCTEHYDLVQRTFYPAYPPHPKNPGVPLRGNINQFNVSEKERVQILPAPPGWLPYPSTSAHIQNQPIRQQDRIPQQPNQDQGYLQAMAKVEGARKNGATCKTNGCVNFGNSKCEGFCNSCYIQIQRERSRLATRDPNMCC